MRAGIALAGLSMAATLLIGCTPDSSQVDVTQVAESEATSVNECDEVIATSQDYSDRINELTKMINEAKKDIKSTKGENVKDIPIIRPEAYSRQILISEQQKLQTLIVYVVADNPQCFSAGLVAEARLQRDALLNN